MNNLYNKFESSVASFAPGYKTMGVGLALASVNTFDWLQTVYQVLPGVVQVLPEPYKTAVNVGLPLIMMWTTGLTKRVEDKQVSPETPK